MSVAVCRGPVMPAFEAPCWLKPAPEPYKPVEAVVVERRPSPPAQVDIWNAIQADVDSTKKAAAPKKEAYVHPLVRRSSSRLLSQKSLEVCTESLGNETGSGDFTASLDDLYSPPLAAAEEDSSFWENNDCDRKQDEECDESKEELAAVNYHCARWSPRRRSFPPPLSSMSRRDGPCLQMRAHRGEGRLVLEAVPVRPRGFLHAARQGGCLRLAFVECSASPQSPADPESNKVTAAAAGNEAPFFPAADQPKNDQVEEVIEEMEEEEEEEEEEVEVVDRGTVVEVKVMSTQPQTPTSGGKVHRSRLVINKFVGSTPLTDQPRHCHADATAHSNEDDEPPTPPKLRRVPSSTTTLAAAVAEASTGSDDDDECGGVHMDASAVAEPKQLLLLTSRRGDKQDILQSVRRCRQLRQKPLFILEPYCIATT